MSCEQTYGFTSAQAAHAAVTGGAKATAVADFFFANQVRTALALQKEAARMDLHMSHLPRFLSVFS